MAPTKDYANFNLDFTVKRSVGRSCSLYFRNTVQTQSFAVNGKALRKRIPLDGELKFNPVLARNARTAFEEPGKE